MDEFREALELDIAQEVVKAAEAYERILAKADAPLDAYLNLANIYWHSVHAEFNTSHKLAPEFIRRAEVRMKQVLHEAERQFPGTPEIGFWYLFFDHIFLDKGPLFNQCKRLVHQSNCSLIPCFCLRCFGYKHAWKYEVQVKDLHESIKNEPTIKNRYIVSVIEATWRIDELRPILHRRRIF